MHSFFKQSFFVDKINVLVCVIRSRLLAMALGHGLGPWPLAMAWSLGARAPYLHPTREEGQIRMQGSD